MGLDVYLMAENVPELREVEYVTGPEHRSHRVSRTFCNLLCRRNVISGPTELDQISRILDLDLSAFETMLEYCDDEDLQDMLRMEKDPARRALYLEREQASRARCANNLEPALATVEELLARLAPMTMLHTLLDDGGFDTLGHGRYFSSLMEDTGDGYIGNNFGQDLRNMKRFLEFVKARGGSTVYFRFG